MEFSNTNYFYAALLLFLVVLKYILIILFAILFIRLFIKSWRDGSRTRFYRRYELRINRRHIWAALVAYLLFWCLGLAEVACYGKTQQGEEATVQLRINDTLRDFFLDGLTEKKAEEQESKLPIPDSLREILEGIIRAGRELKIATEQTHYETYGVLIHVLRDTFPVDIPLVLYTLFFWLLYFLVLAFFKKGGSPPASSAEGGLAQATVPVVSKLAMKKEKLKNKALSFFGEFFPPPYHDAHGGEYLIIRNPFTHSWFWLSLMALVLGAAAIYWHHATSFTNQMPWQMLVQWQFYYRPDPKAIQDMVAKAIQLIMHIDGKLLDFQPIFIPIFAYSLLYYVVLTLRPEFSPEDAPAGELPKTKPTMHLEMFLQFLAGEYATRKNGLFSFYQVLSPNPNESEADAVLPDAAPRFTLNPPVPPKSAGRFATDEEKKKLNILHDLLALNNMDLRFELQNLAIKKFIAHENFVMATSPLSGKTKLLCFLSAYSVLADLNTVMVVVADYGDAEELIYNLDMAYQKEMWYASITRASYRDFVRHGSLPLSPDILFVTPEHLEEIFDSLPNWKNFLFKLGLVAVVELSAYRSERFIRTSFIFRRLISLLHTMRNAAFEFVTDLAVGQENAELSISRPPVFAVTMKPYENAAEICNTFFGNAIVFDQNSILRDTGLPARARRVFIFTYDAEQPDIEHFSQLMPLNIVRHAIAVPFNIHPVVLAGFGKHFLPAERQRMISDTQASHEEFEERVLNLRDLEIPIPHGAIPSEWFSRKYKILESPLAVAGGSISDLIDISLRLSALGLNWQGAEKPVLLLLANNTRRARIYHYFLRRFLFNQTGQYLLKHYRILEIPEYAPEEDTAESESRTLNSIICDQICRLLLDQVNLQQLGNYAPVRGYTAEEIQAIISLDDDSVREAIETLQKERRIVSDARSADYYDHKQQSERLQLNENYIPELRRRSAQQQATGQNVWKLVEHASRRVLAIVDDFDKETLYIPGTIHLIDSTRYKVMKEQNATTTPSKEIFVAVETSVLSSRLVQEIKICLSTEKEDATDGAKLLLERPSDDDDSDIRWQEHEIITGSTPYNTEHSAEDYLEEKVGTKTEKTEEEAGNTTPADATTQETAPELANSTDGSGAKNNTGQAAPARRLKLPSVKVITIRPEERVEVEILVKDIVYWNEISGRAVRVEPIHYALPRKKLELLVVVISNVHKSVLNNQDAFSTGDQQILLEYFYEALEFIVENPREKILCRIDQLSDTEYEKLFGEKPQPQFIGLAFYLFARSRFRTNILQKIEDDILAKNSIEKSIIFEFLNYTILSPLGQKQLSETIPITAKEKNPSQSGGTPSTEEGGKKALEPTGEMDGEASQEEIEKEEASSPPPESSDEPEIPVLFYARPFAHFDLRINPLGYNFFRTREVSFLPDFYEAFNNGRRHSESIRQAYLYRHSIWYEIAGTVLKFFEYEKRAQREQREALRPVVSFIDRNHYYEVTVPEYSRITGSELMPACEQVACEGNLVLAYFLIRTCGVVPANGHKLVFSHGAWNFARPRDLCAISNRLLPENNLLPLSRDGYLQIDSRLETYFQLTRAARLEELLFRCVHDAAEEIGIQHCLRREDFRYAGLSQGLFCQYTGILHRLIDNLEPSQFQPVEICFSGKKRQATTKSKNHPIEDFATLSAKVAAHPCLVRAWLKAEVVYRYNRNHRLWHDYICYQLCLSPVAESIPEELVVLRKLRLEFGLPVRSIISIGPFLRSRQRVWTQREPQETRGANAPTADKNQESTQGAS